MLQRQPVPAALAARKPNVPQSMWPKHCKVHTQAGNGWLKILLDSDCCLDGSLALCEHLRSQPTVARLALVVGQGPGVAPVLGTLTWTNFWEVLTYCCPNLEGLMLENLYMPAAAAAEALGQLAPAGKWPQLKELYLRSVRLDDAGVRALVQGGATHWQQLQVMNMFSNNIGSDGVKVLADAASKSSWPLLKGLVLAENPIGDAGVSLLASAAPHWPKLEDLYLGMTGMGSAGVRAVACAAQYWKSLKTLNMYGNPAVQAEDILALCEAAPLQWRQLTLKALCLGPSPSQGLEQAAVGATDCIHKAADKRLAALQNKLRLEVTL